MRGLSILFWVSAIFIFTCTSSFNGLIETGVVQFQWDSQPKIAELLAPLPEELSSNFLRQKMGHIAAFLILTLLLQQKFHSKLFILLLASTYSTLTEILQLYFSRDGRIFDIGFDMVGILIAIGFASMFGIHQTKQTAKMDGNQI